MVALPGLRENLDQRDPRELRVFGAHLELREILDLRERLDLGEWWGPRGPANQDLREI